MCSVHSLMKGLSVKCRLLRVIVSPMPSCLPNSSLPLCLPYLYHCVSPFPLESFPFLTYTNVSPTFLTKISRFFYTRVFAAGVDILYYKFVLLLMDYVSIEFGYSPWKYVIILEFDFILIWNLQGIYYTVCMWNFLFYLDKLNLY